MNCTNLQIICIARKQRKKIGVMKSRRKKGAKNLKKDKQRTKQHVFFFFFCTLVGSPENFPKREVPVSSLDTSTGKTI